VTAPIPASAPAPAAPGPDAAARAAAEAVRFAAELIAFDTANRGDFAGPGNERPAALYVAEKLAEAGYEPEYVESGAPGRGNVIARLPGADPTRGALLVHGHLDTVPADPAEWSVHPLSGEIRDGYLWGRGAVDMKGMLGMTLAVARALRREGAVPPRDLVFAFVADEEAGGFAGARWLVDRRPELFEGVTEALGEVGGFSVTLPGGRRAYLVQTAEKGVVWLRLKVQGTAGHASMLNDDNPIGVLAAAVARLQAHTFPTVLTPPVRDFLTGVAELTGLPIDLDDPQGALGRLGAVSRMIGASLRDTAAVTMFEAGHKANVVPSVARATVDGRVLPGREEQFEREVADLLGPAVERDWQSLPPVSAPFEGRLAEAMAACIAAEDPGATVLPYLLPAATDAKSFARLGIRHYGFAPLKLPADLDFTALFHGVDERVPVEALEFGTRVLDRLLRTC
jgi:acetylornithine deacetylase/succinyl-diaminopimelate desuccinylase-like protein